MQQNDMAEKKRMYVDGTEVQGLVKVDEYKAEKGTIEVPEFHRIRNIQNGIMKIPLLVGVVKIQRSGGQLELFKNWFIMMKTMML